MILKKLTPPVIAVLLALALLLWLVLGTQYQSKTEAPAATARVPAGLFTVQSRVSAAKPYPAMQKLQGQLQAWHSIELQAQTTGRITKLVRDQGDTVQQGDILLELADEGRSARLDQAKALLALRQSELNSAKALQKQQFVSETELSRLTSELRNAEVNLVEAQLALTHSKPQAPFNGILAKRLVEPGSFIQAGTALFHLVDISQLRATAQIPQQQLPQLVLGQDVKVKLLDGRELPGKLSFISPAAESTTRSYYIEATVSNSNLLPLAGASATLHISLAPVQAHALSPALLKLDNAGRLGVYAVVAEKVVFYPVTLLSADNNQAWVSGLPEQVELITLGAGFVEPGQQVNVKPEGAE
ncbi:secretion protein HlyD [Alishewanella longhuensis]|uniref:Secretion protein HlyD n=1 Tax=Alishewanella longhuensis TaxID=1091037 RepID=A0ABQ3KYV8_9ALTE|nr:efflux RND transporter periplasmic adaptor subunit [Alishewanella longhuensis]GHG71258.1 secretion protein HlyD [Alishewanella longhuensis]